MLHPFPGSGSYKWLWDLPGHHLGVGPVHFPWTSSSWAVHLPCPIFSGFQTWLHPHPAFLLSPVHFPWRSFPSFCALRRPSGSFLPIGLPCTSLVKPLKACPNNSLVKPSDQLYTRHVPGPTRLPPRPTSAPRPLSEDAGFSNSQLRWTPS